MPAITPWSPGTSVGALAERLLAAGSGISIVPDSATLLASDAAAVNLYDGTLSLGIGPGLLLTSGYAPGTANTVGWDGQDNSAISGVFDNGDAAIDAVVNTVFQTQSYDATTLSFSFTVADPSASSISFELVFGSEEYPEWVDQFVDCAVVIVNGVNHALFNHDPMHPLSVVGPNLAAGYFQDNAAGILPIEYDGVSHRLTIVAPIIGGGAVNRITIGIADTGDHVYDSGIFIANLSAGTIPGSGVVVTPPETCTDGDDSVTGSSMDEYFSLQAGNDVVYAGAGDDIVVGGDGADEIWGGSGADALEGDAGDDVIHGGDGQDTAVYLGASTDFTVSADPVSGAALLSSAQEGADSLSGVEFVRFSDGLFALGASGLSPLDPPVSGDTNAPGTALLTGIGAAGMTLSAKASDADGIVGTVAWQWQVSADGQSWLDIGDGADTLTLSVDQVGMQVRAVASYQDGAGIDASVASAPKSVLAAGNGDLSVSLLQIEAPAGSAVANPLTTLVADAIALGLSPNAASTAIKSALGLPADLALQSFDAWSVLQQTPDDATALQVELRIVQIAVTTALSSDETGMNLTLGLIAAADAGRVVDLADATDVGAILGIAAVPDPVSGKYPQPLDEILDRNRSMSDAIADGGDASDLDKEWQDLLSIQDGIDSTSIADLNIDLNLPPTGVASAVLAGGTVDQGVTLTAADLLQGFSDPDGDSLQVAGLSTDAAGQLTDNGDGTWTWVQADPGPVELSYSVIDGFGGSAPASQMFVITAGAAQNHAPTGTVAILGTVCQGETLTVGQDLDDADGLGTLSYQWRCDGVDIPGAVDAGFVPGQAEVGHALTVVVAYTDLAGTVEQVASPASVAVGNIDDEATGTLSVTGVAQEGGSLGAGLSGVSDIDGATTTAFRWQRNAGTVAAPNWTDIAASLSATFQIPSDQSLVGGSIRVVATTTDALGGTTEFNGAALTVANVNDAPTGAVQITGSAVLGQTLSASNTLADADGMDGSQVAYRWYADGLEIASGATLTLTDAMVGRRITAEARYTDAFGAQESVLSPQTAVVSDGKVYMSVATYTGTAAAEWVVGTSAANTISGAAGNDTLDGAAGVDSLNGGPGDDLFIVDLTAAGAMQDKIAEAASAGTDTVALRGASTNTTAATLTLGSNLEHLDAAASGSSLLNLTGNTLANRIVGNAAGNVVTGGAGADTLDGAGGADVYVVAVAGDYTGDRIADTGVSGIDELRFTTTSANATLTLSEFVTGVERLVIGTGTAAAPVTTGTTALNLNAAAISGSVTMVGNAGVNALTGGAGADTLNGGKGADLLTGGAGRDVFVFSASDSGQSSAFDRIGDYARGSVGVGDLIDHASALSIGGSAAAATSTQASVHQGTGVATFAGGSGATLADALADVATRMTAATDKAGEIAFFRVNAAGDYYLFMSDGVAGVGAGDVVVQLLGVTAIGAIDLTGGNLTIIG